MCTACARQWKQSNINGKLKDFEEFYQEVQQDEEKCQVNLNLFSVFIEY